jgi:hypothetical protein
VVISRTEYDFLSGAHQRMDRLEECNNSLLHKLTCSRPFWTDYHLLQEHHFLSHLGSSNERLHRLAEDVKLSTHGRHPTVYPFISCCFYFTSIFIVFSFFLFFSRITFVFYVQRQNKRYFGSSLGVCYEPCQSRQFFNSQVNSFHVVTHWGQCAI